MWEGQRGTENSRDSQKTLLLFSYINGPPTEIN
jgi:hypothetical protein